MAIKGQEAPDGREPERWRSARRLVVVWLAVVSSADGLYAVVLWRPITGWRLWLSIDDGACTRSWRRASSFSASTASLEPGAGQSPAAGWLQAIKFAGRAHALLRPRRLQPLRPVYFTQLWLTYPPRWRGY